MLTRPATVAGQPVTLYALYPSGPWASRPEDLRAWEWRNEVSLKGEMTMDFQGRQLDSVAKGREKSIQSRRAKKAYAKRRRLLG